MTQKIRTLIVDDEPLALRGIKLRLEQFEDIEIVGECRNGREAVRAIQIDKPDLVFLDIQMPGLSGFDVVESLEGTTPPLFVFVTAYDQYAVKAFEAHALDYLLKPVDVDRLADTLRVIRTRMSENAAVRTSAELSAALEALGQQPGAVTAPAEGDFPERINIKDQGRIICVEVTDIEWIDAAGDYMCVHARGETHVMRETMKALEKRLDPKHFKRVHRSAIVNLRKVQSVEPHSNGECFLKLDSGGKVKVSRSYRSIVNRFI